LALIAALAVIGAVAWTYAKMNDKRETITRLPQETIYAADGDSFSIGTRKLRLRGIDAPELNQTCQDAGIRDWACGRAAQGALTLLLAEPGLSCEAESYDRFGRALATCSTAATPDIAAQQVTGGMAITQEFNGMRDYGAEEDSARKSKRGIWRGIFIPPREWRERNGGR
jgi:endonuclease YncB( thermonuclease family)